jgi:hypothetical protein
MLSGIGTHVYNISSNAAHLLWNYGVQRETEAVVNLFTRNKNAAQLGEFKHIFYGVWPGLQQAAVNSIQAMRDEAPVLERTIRGEGIGPNGRTIFDAPTGANTGKKGRLIRIPLALLVSADEAFTSMIANMEVGARAYRIAKGEGLSGAALGDRMNQLTGDRTSLAWHQALGHAEDVLFRGEDSSTKVLEDLINKARNLDPHSYDHGAKRAAARVVKEVSRHNIPFLKTILRIFGTGVRKSPLGSLALVPRLAANGIGRMRHGPTGWTYEADHAVRDIAEQVLAWTAMAALYATLDPDDKDPWITGSGGKYTKQKAELASRTGVDPYTVKINGDRYSYSKLEPFATALGLTVDAMLAIKKAKTKEEQGKASTLAEDASESVLGLVKEKTFMKAIGDLTRTAQGDKPIGDLTRSIATSFIPGILRSTNKATDSTERSTENMPGASWFDKGVASSGVPFVTPPPPKVDLWGRKIDKDSFGNDASGIIGRLISPVKVKHPEILDLDRLISNYNNTAATPYWPITPANYMQVDKKKITFTEDEYQKLLASGAVARKKLEAMKMDPNNPTEQDIKRIKSEIDDAREAVKKEIIKKRKETGR